MPSLDKAECLAVSVSANAMAEAPETHYVRSDDVHIAYQVLGDGPFGLLFVPGFVSNVEALWRSPDQSAFFRRLASFCCLILFDNVAPACPIEVPTISRLSSVCTMFKPSLTLSDVSRRRCSGCRKAAQCPCSTLPPISPIPTVHLRWSSTAPTPSGHEIRTTHSVGRSALETCT